MNSGANRSRTSGSLIGKICFTRPGTEFIGAEHGLGYLINDGRNFFLVPQMLGAAVVLGLLGYAGNGLVRLLERRLTRWQHPA